MAVAPIGIPCDGGRSLRHLPVEGDGADCCSGLAGLRELFFSVPLSVPAPVHVDDQEVAGDDVCSLDHRFGRVASSSTRPLSYASTQTIDLFYCSHLLALAAVWPGIAIAFFRGVHRSPSCRDVGGGCCPWTVKSVPCPGLPVAGRGGSLVTASRGSDCSRYFKDSWRCFSSMETVV